MVCFLFEELLEEVHLHLQLLLLLPGHPLHFEPQVLVQLPAPVLLLLDLQLLPPLVLQDLGLVLLQLQDDTESRSSAKHREPACGSERGGSDQESGLLLFQLPLLMPPCLCRLHLLPELLLLLRVP